MLIAGCARDEHPDGFSGKLKSVTFTAICEPMPECGSSVVAGTKSTIPTEAESQIKRLRVAAYDMASGIKLSDTGEMTEGDIASVNIELFTKHSFKVYFAANMRGLIFPDRNGPEDLSWMLPSFESMESEGLPMSGCLTVTAEDIAKGSLVCYLRRLVSKVNLTLDLRNVTDGELTLSGARLHNMNRRLIPFEGQQESRALSSSDIVSGTVLGEDNDTDGCAFDKADWARYGYVSTAMYIPANLQGDLLPSNDDPDIKVPQSIGEAASLCSYVQLYGHCDGFGDMEGAVSYRFYLGENSTKNFDVRPNSVYNVTFTPTADGVSRQDWWKVDASSLEPSVIKSFAFSAPSLGMDIQDESTFSIKYMEDNVAKSGNYMASGRSGWHFECSYENGTQINSDFISPLGPTYWGADEFKVSASITQNTVILVKAITNDGKATATMRIVYNSRMKTEAFDDYYIKKSINDRSAITDSVNLDPISYSIPLSNRPFPISGVAKTRIITYAYGAHNDEIENNTDQEDDTNPKFPIIRDVDRLCHFDENGFLRLDLSKKKWHETQNLALYIYFWNPEGGGSWSQFGYYTLKLVLCDAVYTLYDRPLINSHLVNTDSKAPLMQKMRADQFNFSKHVLAANPWTYVSHDTNKDTDRTNGHDGLGTMFFNVEDYTSTSEMLPYVLDIQYYYPTGNGNTMIYSMTKPTVSDYARVLSYGMWNYHLPY